MTMQEGDIPNKPGNYPGGKLKSVSCPVVELARVYGLLGRATYTVEFGRQPPGVVGEACSPEVGEPY